MVFRHWGRPCAHTGGKSTLIAFHSLDPSTWLFSLGQSGALYCVVINVEALFAKSGLSNIILNATVYSTGVRTGLPLVWPFLSCIHGISLLRHLTATYWLDSVDDATHSRPDCLSVESDSYSQASISRSSYLLPSRPPTSTCDAQYCPLSDPPTPIVLSSEGRAQSEEPAPCIFASAFFAVHRLDVCTVKPRRWRHHATSTRRSAIHAWRFSSFCDALLLAT